ncbi:MAG: helix-turn-helix domain-containing protein, partial [Actinomycetota bacterium]|nr:helix-turn-helix domain-containing protein [Actinomycetota bacterium]
MNDETLTLKEAAEMAGVSPSTLRRWASAGVIPRVKGARGEDWTAAAASHARVVARLRERGHKLEEIRKATEEGRLAYGFVEDMFPESQGTRTLEDAAAATGLEPALIERFWTSLGLPAQGLDNL